MRIQYKLLLIFIVFLGFIIFNNNICFGAITLEDVPQEVQDIPYYSTNFLPKFSDLGIDEFDMLVFRFNYSSKAPEELTYCIIISTDFDCNTWSFTYDPSVGNTSPIVEGNLLNNILVNYKDKYSPHIYFSSSTSNSITYFDTEHGHSFSNYLWDDSYPLYNNLTILYSTRDVVRYDVSTQTTNFLATGESFSKVDKLNLFELNLTDLDYNNTVHQFNLSTYTDSPCYDELINLVNFNNKYCIYLTDYTRLLTFETNHLDSPLVSGAYLLSGYIDFLLSDNAYFYYSPHYNRIKISSGDYLSGIMTDKAKRFFFTLVFSVDSDNTYFTIQENNGSLWAVSDYTSDFLEDKRNSYFIGSNQKIYYAKEDNNYILDGLTNSIYYGKEKREKNKVYNFGLIGGHTKSFFLNDYNCTSNIATENQSILDKQQNQDIIKDNSNGKSTIISIDSSTYTYNYNTVTDDTFNDNDLNNIENERYPYVSDNSTDDDTNWSIIDYFKYFKQKTKDDEVKSNTTSDNITSSLTTLLSTFSFYKPIMQNVEDIKNYIINTQETHKYYLNINHKYLSGNVCIIDLSWYEPYKPTVDAFICAFAYLSFTWHVFCRIPNLISGSSVSSYINDISSTISMHNLGKK